MAFSNISTGPLLYSCSYNKFKKPMNSPSPPFFLSIWWKQATKMGVLYPVGSGKIRRLQQGKGFKNSYPCINLACTNGSRTLAILQVEAHRAKEEWLVPKGIWSCTCLTCRFPTPSCLFYWINCFGRRQVIQRRVKEGSFLLAPRQQVTQQAATKHFKALFQQLPLTESTFHWQWSPAR